MATIDNTVNLVDVGDQSGKSSASARKTALINFDMFMEYIFTKDSCNYPHKSLSMSMPPEFFTKDVIGKFADYLVKVKKNWQMRYSVSLYFSNQDSSGIILRGHHSTVSCRRFLLF